MSTPYIQQIASLENLILAWRKLERAFDHGDVWYDELCIAAFKMNLLDELKDISMQISSGNYKLQPMQPIPFPKGGKDKEDKLRVRQSFFVDFKDQLVWVAVFNVIGRSFDKLMPAWSYGNRQYVSMWMEKNEEGRHWVVGNHRNTKGLVYRKWNQSWPLMRKRITTSLKRLARLGDNEFDDTDKEVENEESKLTENQKYIKLGYLASDYFPSHAPYEKLYWAGIDLTEFYQRVEIGKVKEKIIEIIKDDDATTPELYALLDNLCEFKLDFSDYDYPGAEKDLESMQLSKDVLVYEGLPTGLIVAGMLANIYMLNIDHLVEERLKENHEVIHFRYVDDHVIVSTSEETLYEWLAWYQQLLNDNNLKLNISKLEPNNLLHNLNQSDDEEIILLEHKDQILGNIREFATLDPKYPTPLMTQTLQKVSMLQGLNLNMLSSREYEMVFGELQSLLVSDLSNQEIKESTRISFACTMLSRLLVDGFMDYDKIHDYRLRWLLSLPDIKRILENSKSFNSEEARNDFIADCTAIIFCDGELKDLEDFKNRCAKLEISTAILDDLNALLIKGNENKKAKERQVFNMLLFALDKVPDKVRVWIRAFVYCVRHQPNGIRRLYDKLDTYRDDKLHPLSVDYLTALLNTLCAESIIRAVARVVFDDYKNPCDKQMDMDFLKHVLSMDFASTSPHFFVKDSQYLVHKALSFYNMFAKSHNWDEVSTDEYFFRPRMDYHANNLDSTFWLLWISEILNRRGKTDKRIFSELLASFNDEAKLDSKYFATYFQMYLNEATLLHLPTMMLPDDLTPEAPWLTNHLKYTIAQLDEMSVLQSKILSAQDVELFKNMKNDNFLTITQWIDFVNTLNPKDTNWEVQTSEILPILMVLSIIDCLEAKGENVHDCKIHPENFRFSQEELCGITWNECISLIEQKKRLEVTYVQNKGLDESLYQYPCILNEQHNPNISISYGLGIVLLQLISKQKVIPWAMNSAEVGFEWQSVLHKIQDEGQISSLTYRVIGACLSSRQRENAIMRMIYQDFIDETFMDNPKIENWQQLKDELCISLDQLRNNLISVADEAHRQLVVLDLY